MGGRTTACWRLKAHIPGSRGKRRDITGGGLILHPIFRLVILVFFFVFLLRDWSHARVVTDILVRFLGNGVFLIGLA